MDRKEAAIAALELFRGCRHKDITWVAANTDMLYLRPGTELALEGKAVREFIVLVDGEASVTARNGAARTLGAGEYFGHEGLVDRLPHKATVEVTKPARALVFEARAFHGLLDKLPTVSKKLMRDLVIELRQVDRRVSAAAAPQLGAAS